MKLSLDALASELLHIRDDVPELQRRGLEKAATFIETEVKAMFGVYQTGWPELAEATLRDRLTKGYTADEPLLRSGQLRDSYGHVVTETSAHIGSNDPRAEWIETGTKNMPPRPVLQTVLAQKGEQIAEMVASDVALRLGGRPG